MQYHPMTPLNYHDAAQGKSQIYLICDASAVGIAAILCQGTSPDNVPQKIAAITSQAFNSSQHNYHTTDKEHYAIYHACETFKHLLLGCHFTILTDHAALAYMDNASITNKRRIRWIRNM